MNIGYLMIITSMLIWGSIGLIVRWIDQPPEVIVFFRVFIGFISIIIIGLLKGNRLVKKGKENWVLLILSGVFLALNWTLFFKAIKTTTVALATLSYYTAPVIVTILSFFVLKEKISNKTKLAIILSFLGIFIMVFSGGSVDVDFNPLGIVYGLMAALFYALVTITVKMLENVSSYRLVMIQTGISSIMFLPTLRGLNKVDMESIIFLIIIGTIYTSIALTLYFEGIKRVKVQHVGIISYIDPLSAVVFATIFLGEVPDMYTLIGGILILLSTYIVLKRKRAT